MRSYEKNPQLHNVTRCEGLWGNLLGLCMEYSRKREHALKPKFRIATSTYFLWMQQVSMPENDLPKPLILKIVLRFIVLHNRQKIKGILSQDECHFKCSHTEHCQLPLWSIALNREERNTEGQEPVTQSHFNILWSWLLLLVNDNAGSMWIPGLFSKSSKKHQFRWMVVKYFNRSAHFVIKVKVLVLIIPIPSCSQLYILVVLYTLTPSEQPICQSLNLGVSLFGKWAITS